MNSTYGTLFLIPSPLAQNTTDEVLTQGHQQILTNLRHFIVEEIRTVRRFLRKCDPTFPIDESTFLTLNEHTRPEQLSEFIKPLLNGHDMGLVSEAGMPCIADPGADIVRLAHEKGIKVVPFTGPSSIFLALAASGFNGQSFVFHGYLPVDKNIRSLKIKEIEKQIYTRNQTQIFIETPYRNHQLYDAILSSCQNDTMLCIARDLTSTDEWIKTLRVNDWKKQSPGLHKHQVVFLLYK
jgi:16S rRNA (cytidine1402-2'-O)-methyltransferase